MQGCYSLAPARNGGKPHRRSICSTTSSARASSIGGMSRPTAGLVERRKETGALEIRGENDIFVMFPELRTNSPCRQNAQQMLRSSLSSPRFRAQVTGGLRYGALKQSF